MTGSADRDPGSAAEESEVERAILREADIAFDRVMAGVESEVQSMPPDLEAADAVRWAGDRVTELLAGFAELPLDRLLGLDGDQLGDHDHEGDPDHPAGDPPAAPAGEPLTVQARAGGRAEVRIWVHPMGTAAPGTLRFMLSDLVAAAGDPLPGVAAQFEPAELALPAPAGSSAVLSLRVPVGTGAGSYHGVVVGRGVPGAAVPITVVIR